MQDTIFPPPTIRSSLPLLWVRYSIPFCSPPEFCTAVLLSKSIFVSIWPILQYHHSSVPCLILAFASFIGCSVPLQHFSLLLLYFRRLNHKRWVRSALAKTLFSWCVGPFPGKSTPRPLPPSGGHWRYHAAHHPVQHNTKRPRPPSVLHSRPKRPHLQSQTPLRSNQPQHYWQTTHGFPHATAIYDPSHCFDCAHRHSTASPPETTLSQGMQGIFCVCV